MNSSIYRFTLGMNSSQSQISIPVMLGDTGREWHINLSGGGRPYIIADGCLAKLSIKRPTGTRLEEFCSIEDNTTIVYKFDQNENTCAVEGIHNCDISLYGLDGRVIATARFTMVVSERVVARDDVVLTDEDFTAVDAMLKAETQRQNNEAQRVDAETVRISAEESRSSAEEERISAEKARVEAEEERISAESERKTAEVARISAENERAYNEEIRVSKDERRDAAIQGAVDASGRAEANSTSALEKANRASEDVVGFRAEIGTEALSTGQNTVKASVNYAVGTANIAKNQSDVTRTNLINLSAQVQGIGRSYVVPDFSYFIDFLNSIKSIALKEDRDGDGVDETYNVYISDIKTGDNIIIVETGVPDFWFEKNTALSSFETYTYNNTEYILSAKSSGVTIGGAHILETDYTVIEGYAMSASASAQDAKQSATAAETSATNAFQSEQNAFNSEVNAYVSEQKAKRVSEEIVSRVDRNDKRITNLEQGITPEPFETDSSVAYVKDVPENALPYAEIAKVGGMTHKCNNLFNQDQFFTGRGFTKQSDGSWLCNTIHMSVFTPAVSGKMYFKVTAKSTGVHTSSPFKIQVRYSDGTNEEVCSLANSQADWITIFGSSNSSKTITSIYFTCGGGTGPRETHYIKDLIFSYSDVPYEPYYEGLRDTAVTEVKSVGVNLTTAKTVYDGTRAYAEMLVDGRNCIRMTSGAKVATTPCYFKVNTQYTVSFDSKCEDFGGATGPNCVFAFFYSDGTRDLLYAPRTDTNWTHYTYTSAADKTVEQIGVMAAQYQIYNYIDTDTFMFNEGATALPYTPYMETSFPIPSEVQALDGYGWGVNEDCYNYIDWETKTFVKRVEKFVLDGTEAWTKSATSVDTRFQYYIKHEKLNTKPNGQILSNYLSIRASNDQIGYFSGGAGFGVNVDISEVSEWMSFLSERYANGNPVIVYIELATPEVTDISDLITPDNFIKVEGGGTITAVNEHSQAVPTEITYMVKEVSV